MASYRKLLKDAVDASTAHQVWRLQNCCLNIIAAIPNPNPDYSKAAVVLFRTLRGHQRYEQLQMLGEAFLKAGYETPRLWTTYAQALIERGNHVAALGVLGMLLANKSEEAKRELRETYGLCGRAWKDIGYEAVRAKRKDVATRALKESHAFYVKGYRINRQDPELIAWCGSQRVALSHFAKVNGIEGLPDEKQFSREAVKALQEAIADPATHPALEPWLMLGCAELCVAVGDLERATELCEQVIARDKHVDKFMLGSLYKQLSQVWQIGGSETGARLDALLMSAIDQHGGLVLTKDATLQLQARLPGNKPGWPVTAMREMLRRANSIAMIRGNYYPLGTGFVVDANELGLAATGKVVLTNAHVVSEPPQWRAAAPADVQVHFGLVPGLFGVRRIIDCLPVDGHDCTALELDGEFPDGIEALSFAKVGGDGKAYVVGHPLGQELTFSLDNAQLVECEPQQALGPQRLRYTSTTEVGSSGSPVFNANLKVIGIHCASRPSSNGTDFLNEGISLASISEAFRARRNGKEP